jgi:hypothetical protein
MGEFDFFYRVLSHSLQWFLYILYRGPDAEFGNFF